MRALLAICFLALGLVLFGPVGLGSDTTPPTSAATISPEPNEFGWNNTPVFVLITATDDASGVGEIRYRLDGGPEMVVPGASATVEVSGEGRHTLEFWAVDRAGNEEPHHLLPVWIDLTPPKILVRSPTEGARYILHQRVIADWFALDRLSGILDVEAPARSGEPLDTSRAGMRTFTIRALDRAGNAVVVEVEYGVLYIIEAKGSKGFFLDRLLPEKERKLQGKLPLMARYRVGEGIVVSFSLYDVGHNPVTTARPNLMVTQVTFEDGKEHHTIWTLFLPIPYDAETGQYRLIYPTEGREPGIYDLWISFGDGQHQRIRIALLPPEGEHEGSG